MSQDSQASVVEIIDQMKVLRASVSELESMDDPYVREPAALVLPRRGARSPTGKSPL